MIEDVNVFDFLETSENLRASRAQLPESHMLEDSLPPAYEEKPPTPKSAAPDVLKFQIPDEDEYRYTENGFAYGTEPIRPTSERYESSYNLRPQEADYNFTTPAPKAKHSRTKSRDKDFETATQKADRKRKRNSPSELDLTEARAMQQQQRDIIMADDTPTLHSGLTGGLNRLLTRPELPPSPDYSGDYVADSPLSPIKRAKQGASKAFARAQKEFETQKERERKAEIKAQLAREKEEKKERGRAKDRKVSTALVKIRPKVKRRDDSAVASRRQREGERRRRRQYSSSPSPEPGRKPLKAIEYHRSDSHSPTAEQTGDGAMIVRPNGDLAPVRTGVEARAELFMSFINKGPESERGMSVNKTLKRYHRERYDRWDHEIAKAEEEKELWKSLRLKRNDRGEVVVFFATPDA